MSDAAAGVKSPPVDVKEDELGGAIATFPVDKKTGDERLGRDPDDGGQDDGADGADSVSRNTRRGRARRERQRQTRQEREQQIADLGNAVVGQQRMIQALARNQQEQSLQTLQREADQAKAAHAEAQRRHAEAVEKGDGRAASEAMTVMNNASNYYQQVLGSARQIATAMQAMPADQQDDQQHQQQDRQPNGRTPRLSERAENFKQDFLDNHPWIDLDDPSSATTAAVLAIDTQVMRDGFKPGTQDYWDEVSERLREEMPHKFTGGKQVQQEQRREPPRRQQDDDDDDDNQQQDRQRRRGGPPLGGAGNRGGQLQPGQLRLTPEMVSGLEQAGIPLTGGDEAMQRRRTKILQSYRDNAPKQ